jgi:lipopolysaccharide/colanic/teichoic acid biosynthesis glycosyltransferase
MTNSIISTVENSTNTKQLSASPYCTLQWRRGQLLVKTPGKVKLPYIAALEKEELLVDCLKHSPIDLVKIDPKIGQARIKFWADASEQASKSIFLNIPSACQIPDSHWLLRGLQRITDMVGAFVLLPLLGLVIVFCYLLMLFNSSNSHSSSSLFDKEWHVGKRGKLFRVSKFGIEVVNKKNVNSEWHLFLLENLPLLLNVLRGDMSLIGRPCFSLEEAVKLNTKGLTQLNRVPGILPMLSNSDELDTSSNLLHLDSQTL